LASLTVIVTMRYPWYFKLVGRPLAVVLLLLVWLRLVSKDLAQKVIDWYISAATMVRIGSGEWHKMGVS
jgi:hypothetical protein